MEQNAFLPEEESGTPAGEVITIHPDRLYDVEEVRTILRPRKPMHADTVYRIPERLLPKTRVGPRRGNTMWKGAHLLAYLEGKTVNATRHLKAVS